MIIYYDFNSNMLTKNKPEYPDGHRELMYIEQNNGDFVAIFKGEPWLVELDIDGENK